MHMRTTLNLDDELLRRAREYTGIQEKTALIHAAMRQLIACEAAKRLAALAAMLQQWQQWHPQWQRPAERA